MHLNLPPSDVAGDTVPYTVEVVREGTAEAEVKARLSVRRGGADAAPTELCAVEAAPAGRAALRLSIDVAPLAEGEYEGVLEVEAGGEAARVPVRLYRMPTPPPRGVPFAIYAIPHPADRAGMDAVLERLSVVGIDLLCPHMDGMEVEGPFLDRAARYGLRFCPSANLGRNPDRTREAWPEDRQAVLTEGAPPAHRARPSPCFLHPEVRRRGETELQATMESCRRHAGFSGRVYYGDDLFMAVRFAQGRAWISCLCDACRAAYRDRFGEEPPRAVEPVLGVVADDHPWLRWMRHRCEHVYGGFVQGLVRARDDAAPDVKLGLCHGWPDNPFTSVATGLYGPLTQPRDVVSSYAYPYLRAPCSDLIGHYELGGMGRRGAERWMLGLFLADRCISPDWQIYQNYWNMLAAGYDMIGFFSWHDYAAHQEQGDDADRARADAALDALARCGAHKDWILPAAALWERPAAEAAVLFSFTTEAFDVAPVHRGNLHTRRVLALHRLALRRQLDLEFVSEEEVLEGCLDRYRAVCLHDVRVLPEGVRSAVQAFADRGGQVLLDPDPLYMDGWHPQARVEVKGGIEMNPETMIEVLCGRLARPIRASGGDVTIRRFRAGDAVVLVLVNAFTDRYAGMSYAYGDPAQNDARADLVRNEAVTTTLALDGPRRWVFDLSSGERLGASDAPLDVQLDPGWGRVLTALPVESARLQVTAPAEARLGERVRFALEFRDEQGRTVDTPFVVRVEISTPSGRRSGYSGPTGIPAGRGSFLLPLGCNDETGTWTLVFEGGLPRSRQVCRIDVSAEAPRRARA